METDINKGAFQIARKIFESDLWLQKPDSWKVLWIYILGRVSHKTSGKLVRGEGYFNFTQERKLISNSISPDTIKRALAYMRAHMLIRTTKSTRGIRINVVKYDYYQNLNNYTHQSAHHRRTTDAPLYNKKLRIINTDVKTSSLSNKTKKMLKYNETDHQDSFLPEVDMETGEVKSTTKKREPKNKTALSILAYFNAMAFKNTGTQPAPNQKGYFLVLNAINKHKLTNENLKQKIDDWFSSGEPAENLVQITRCLSDNSINSWKVNNSIR